MRPLAIFSDFLSRRNDTPKLLIVPGLNNSGPDHWQSRWENGRSDTQRADLGQWDRPAPKIWVDRLDQAVKHADGPVLLVAHSLGCHAVAHWAQQTRAKTGGQVVGALLVAPPEVDRGLVDWRLQPFAPARQSILPFPSIVAASRNDPYIHFERARRLAFFWGSQFADAGHVGHINAESGIGDWEFGQFLLSRLIRLAAKDAKQPPGTGVNRASLIPAPIITA